MKALIVEDVEMNRELLAFFLRGRAAIVFACSGEEAISLVEDALRTDSRFDLICMDIGLPGISGHEALKTIRELEAKHGNARAKVFMVTGSSAPDDCLIWLGGSDDPPDLNRFSALFDQAQVDGILSSVELYRHPGHIDHLPAQSVLPLPAECPRGNQGPGVDSGQEYSCVTDLQRSSLSQ